MAAPTVPPTVPGASPGTESVFRPGLFKGQAAIVTGGGTGIGLAVTRELLSLGCNVLICSRSLAKLEAARASLERDPAVVGRLAVHPCNIRKEDDVRATVAEALARFGRLDLLVNNGGGQFICPAEEMTSNGFRAVVETNLVGAFLMCREAFTQRMRDHGGAVVNISMVVRNGVPRMAHSGAARAGVENLTKSLATEFARAGVRVNCVAPGVIYTPSGFENYGALGQVFLEAITPALPTKRLGTAEEVAAAVVFLLGPGAAYVTGATVGVDGGSAMVGYPFPLADTGDTSHFPVYGDASVLPPAARL